jgi:insulysin
MPTLSQPQTPADLDSPLREHRHRPVERLTDRLETPSLDDRSYRVIRLPNQLEVLLVHDAETDKASAAMDVNVGNFSDESEMPGTFLVYRRVLKPETNIIEKAWLMP